MHHNCYIYLLETNEALLDEDTDLIISQTEGANLGKISWQNTFIVTAKNWSEGKGIDVCTYSTGSVYQSRSGDDDKILPKYTSATATTG
jgi:hypothetical protein